ncbi:MAG: hypothetical protein K6G38_00095 [Gammaproteobacteria bacterium]|nr:hypothetical protein [Gammaproteobacteria bacterium]
MKNKIIGFTALGIFLSLFVFSIVMFNKYKSFKILSIKQEYSLVSTSSNHELSIPLYFEKSNSFLTKKKNVKSTYIENDDYSFITYLSSIIEGETISYNGTKYKEFIFKISFSSYSDFNDVVYVENGRFKITYQNAEEMSFSIGNLELYFNERQDDSNLQIMQLSAITNYVSGIETIVGVNLNIRNDNKENVTIKSVKTLNKFYEFDYAGCELETLEFGTNLRDRYGSYSYTTLSVSDEVLNISLKSDNYLSMFIPLKYLNGIRYVYSLPIFITYSIDDIEYTKIIDSFIFMSKDPFYVKNGVKEYVYSYK